MPFKAFARRWQRFDSLVLGGGGGGRTRKYKNRENCFITGNDGGGLLKRQMGSTPGPRTQEGHPVPEKRLSSLQLGAGLMKTGRNASEKTCAASRLPSVD